MFTSPSRLLPAWIVLLTALPLLSADWVDLLPGNLDLWDRRGDGVWFLMRDKILAGQRDPKLKNDHQAWLYTKKEYGEFDLHAEWWLPVGGNSGISIRDSSRAVYAIGPEFGAPHDSNRTPSHIGYEIQLSNGLGEERFPSGSVYLFDKAKVGAQIPNDWNALDLEIRADMMRVKLNGTLVSQHPGDPGRPKTGPVGLQLHDRRTLVMFRNVRIREAGNLR
ncbi:MAG: DUF1080 domain-containing protein [Bryobacterales bacterium]|nr:DUF1080 domain-containing protein [Bryobacterales bacterium]